MFEFRLANEAQQKAVDTRFSAPMGKDLPSELYVDRCHEIRSASKYLRTQTHQWSVARTCKRDNTDIIQGRYSPESDKRNLVLIPIR